MNLTLLAIGWLMVVATAIPVLRKDAWWIRMFDFPRVQIVVVSVAVLIAYCVTTDTVDVAGGLFIIALSASLLHQGHMMFPYFPFAKKQVQKSQDPKKESSLSLLTANVLMKSRGADRLREIIRHADPDVILTVECDAWWQDQLRDLERTHPYKVHQPQANTYGMLLYSRLELIDPEVKFLIQDDIPSIHASVALPSGQRVELHCMHPRPPFPTEDESSTDRDAELLLVGKKLKPKEIPVIVMGDLNDVAWSRTNYLFQNISGLLDPRIGRGFFNTFHANLPFMRFPLDHFFHSNHFRLIEFKRLAYFGSDHFPVFISLSYEPDAATEQPELQATGNEEARATEKIAKAS
ncbi:MAG: endonuclease/exonuclease/phosphatase family protein [Pseudomonadota bacterium]